MDKETYNNLQKIQKNIQNNLKKKAMRTTTTTTTYIKESDRMIQIMKEEWGEIIGINYFQGNEIPFNLPIDKELTKYVLERLNSFNRDIQTIDNLIWMYINRGNLLCEFSEIIEQQISEIVQNNCSSGDVSPSQTLKLEEYTNKLADLVAEIVVQNQ